MDNMENKTFLEDYFKEKEDLFLPPAKNVTKKFNPKVDDVDFFKEKNSLYMHLTDNDTYFHFKKLVNSMPDFATQNEFADHILTYEIKMSEKEIEVDDYSFISLRRLRMFTQLHKEFLAGRTPQEKKQIKAWHSHQLTSANFNGHCALNGHLDRDFVVWARTDNSQKLKKLGLIDQNAHDHPYLIFVFYKRNADYPYSNLVHLEEEQLAVYDPTNISSVVSEEIYEDLKGAHVVSFWDQAEFFQSIVDGEVPFKKKIDLRTPQLRFKFIRQYFAGLSQSQLASELQSNFGIKVNQKNIEYWEKSKSEFPPFVKNDMLSKCVEIFCESSYDFFSYELRTDVMKDGLLSKAQAKNRLHDLILDLQPKDRENPFFNNLTLYPKAPKTPSRDVEVYRDAMRRYGVEERLAKKTVRSFDDLSAEDFAKWGYMMSQISEAEIVRDLQLVYDNEPMRAKIYHLWRNITMNLVFNTDQRSRSIDPPF